MLTDFALSPLRDRQQDPFLPCARCEGEIYGEPWPSVWTPLCGECLQELGD